MIKWNYLLYLLNLFLLAYFVILLLSFKKMTNGNCKNMEKLQYSVQIRYISMATFCEPKQKAVEVWLSAGNRKKR